MPGIKGLSTKYSKGIDAVGEAVSATSGLINPPQDAFDIGNPRSMMSLLPTRWAQGFEEAYRTHAEYFEMTERELYKHLKKEGKAPDSIINTIRIRLWLEYERCQAGDGRRIEIFKVLGEVCRAINFEKFILSRPDRAAWLLCPPTSYHSKVEEALDFGISKLRDILDLDVITTTTLKNGKKKTVVNTKLGELQAKIVNMLDVRVHGAARVRIDQNVRQVSLNLHHTSGQVSSAIEDMTAESLEAQIKILERQERKALNLPPESDFQEIEVVAEDKESSDGVVIDSALVDVPAMDSFDTVVDKFG
jgi:hypothetical protein